MKKIYFISVQVLTFSYHKRNLSFEKYLDFDTYVFHTMFMIFVKQEINN